MNRRESNALLLLLQDRHLDQTTHPSLPELEPKRSCHSTEFDFQQSLFVKLTPGSSLLLAQRVPVFLLYPMYMISVACLG